MPEWKPLIIAASFDPNPVNVGSSTVLSVIAVDTQVGQVTEVRYSGEFRGGEV